MKEIEFASKLVQEYLTGKEIGLCWPRRIRTVAHSLCPCGLFMTAMGLHW